MKHNLFSLVLSFLIFCASYAVAQAGTESYLSMEDCDNMLNELNLTLSIDSYSLIESFKCLEEKIFSSIRQSLITRDDEEENRLLVLYLSHAHLLRFSYDLGCIKEHSALMTDLDDKIHVFMKAIKQNALSYLKYADYLYLKLPYGDKKAIHALPIIYRKVLLFEKDNKEALVKLAMWYIFPANEGTSNFRGMIENAEQYIEELTMSEKFRAYLMYSIYYMRCYNRERGFEYLEKANKIFPHHIYVAHLWNNYLKGKLDL